MQVLTSSTEVCISYDLIIINTCEFNCHKIACKCSSDLRYISIWQYIDAVIEYRIMILCLMNIEVSKWLNSAE